jgi:hypothetical protein
MHVRDRGAHPEIRHDGHARYPAAAVPAGATDVTIAGTVPNIPSNSIGNLSP